MSVTASLATPLNVSKYLAMCGFKRSRMDARTITDGFRVEAQPLGRVGCTVTWIESLASSIERRDRLGLESFGDLPDHPDEASMLEAYWEALDNRYDVGRGFIGGTVYVSPRTEPRSAVPGRPTRARVKGLLEDAGVGLMSMVAPHSNRRGVSLTQEHDHVRLLVRPWVSPGPWEDEVLSHSLKTVKDTVLNGGFYPIHFSSRDCREGYVVRVYSE